MPIRYSLLAVSAIAFGSAPLSAETLADAIALAYQTNPTLAAGRYDLRSVDEGLVQARAQLRPSAELDVTGTLAHEVQGRAAALANPNAPGTITRRGSQSQVIVSQPLFTGGRATAARDSAVAAIRSGRQVLRGTEGDLILSVITAYMDIRRYQAVHAIWTASVDELTRITREIDARRIAGELTRTDVAQAQGQLLLARQQAVAAEQALEAARADYAALVGRNPGDLAEAPGLPDLPRRVEEAFALAESQNPELARAVFTEQGSRADIAAAEAQGMPTLALRGSATSNGNSAPYELRQQDQNYTGSVVLTVPLTAGGLIASRIRQAEDRNGGDRFRIEAARREMTRNVSLAWNQMVTADSQANLQAEQRAFAVTQLDGMINEYRVGLRSTFDVLYAQQTLRDAQVALIGSERDRYVAQAALLRQTGLLEARAVLMGVQLHDPAKHLRDVEYKNAFPWDGLFAAFDRVGTARPRQRALERPGVSGETPALAPARETPAQRSLSRALPITPRLGTIGRPAANQRTMH